MALVYFDREERPIVILAYGANESASAPPGASSYGLRGCGTLAM